MKLKIDVLTLFPSFFKSPLQESLLLRAQKDGKVEIRVHNLRDHTHDRHKTADDKPFGGGPGMVMKPEPIFKGVEAVRRPGDGWVVLLDPQGKPLTQKRTRQLSRKKHLILIAGHYEGVDHRVREGLVDEEISVGNFVTMGGEAPALCLIEAVVRLVPGVLGNEDSLKNESFSPGGLEYPQYTRPRSFRGMRVPEVLLSGDHKQLETWRRKMAAEITRKKRPDLIRSQR